MGGTSATRSSYALRACVGLLLLLLLLLLPLAAGCASDAPAGSTDRGPTAMAGEGGGGASGVGAPLPTAGAGGAGGAGGTGAAGTLATGSAGSSGDAGAAGDTDPMFHNPTDMRCTDAELATACDELECGLTDACPQQPCGECEEGVPCQAGVCLTADEFCAQSPEMCECLPVMFSVPTRQACSLTIASGTEIDGEAFVDVDGGHHRVLAIDRWGEGHVIAWCDGSTNSVLLMAFQALPYLGRKPVPRFASFGNQPLCDPDFGVEHFDQAPTYLGAELPAQYLGHPELLAADWDVLLFCGFHTMWDPGWAKLLQDYVTVEGKGLIASMDYQGFDATVEDFAQMNSVMMPSGISFDPVSINWADATADIGIACLPDLTPAVL